MYLKTFTFHLRARNLSPRTIIATEDYLRPFLATRDPLQVTRHDIEDYLGRLAERCRPATVFTAWRHLTSFYKWLESEGDIVVNPMARVPKPIVPPIEIPIPTIEELRSLLDACKGLDVVSRRDYALITMLLDTGLLLTEVTNLKLDDISEYYTLRVFGKGRKWRTVQLGQKSSEALRRWIRMRKSDSDRLWVGRVGPLTASGVRRIVKKRGQQVGIHLHPHMLRHSFVDNWLRCGGSEIDLARLCGWTTTRMAGRYAQHRADERAIAAHAVVRPLDGMLP